MSKRFKWLLVLVTVAALLIAGRLYRLHVRHKWLKQVIVNKNESFVDITLPVISTHCDAHGGCIVETDGLYQGQPTGLTVIFAPNMKPSTFTDRVETSQVFAAKSGITLVVEGPRGRSLLRLLIESYGIPAHHLNLPATVPATAIALEGNPLKIETLPLKFKMFLSSNDASEYFELYVNTDLANKQIELSEKDPGYRAAILKSLGAD